MKLFFLTHHKCASGWFNKINFDLFKLYGRVVHVLNDNDANYKNINEFYKLNNTGLLSFNNADAKYIDFNDNFRAIHVIRDPRDIILSGYFSHKKVHPIFDNEESDALIKHRELLNKVDLEEGLNLEIIFSKKWYLEKMIGMCNVSSNKILRVKLEDISPDYINVYKNFLSFYNLNLGGNTSNLVAENLNKISVPLAKRKIIFNRGIHQNKITDEGYFNCLNNKSFEKISGRVKGQENSNNHYRKGVFGDWKNHFSETNIIQFNLHFPNLIEKLGY